MFLDEREIFSSQHSSIKHSRAHNALKNGRTVCTLACNAETVALLRSFSLSALGSFSNYLHKNSGRAPRFR